MVRIKMVVEKEEEGKGRAVMVGKCERKRKEIGEIFTEKEREKL
jgi:hypothetical protein